MNDELARIDAEAMEQMDLALQGEKLYIDYSEEVAGGRDDRYTAARFIKEHPERAELAIRLIALSFGNKPVGKKVHCDPRVVRELRFRCVKEVNQQREMLRETIFPGVMLSAERAMELLPAANNSKDAAITHGILRDSYMQLSGLPTAKIEVNHHFDVGAELRKLNEEAREMIKQAKARVIDPVALEEGTATA